MSKQNKNTTQQKANPPSKPETQKEPDAQNEQPSQQQPVSQKNPAQNEPTAQKDNTKTKQEHDAQKDPQQKNGQKPALRDDDEKDDDEEIQEQKQAHKQKEQPAVPLSQEDRLARMLEVLEGSIKSIETKIEESKKIRVSLQQELDKKQKMIEDHFEKENQAVEKALSADIKEALKRGDKYKQKLNKEIEQQEAIDAENEKLVIQTQLDIDQLRLQQKKLLTEMREIEIQSRKFSEKELALEKVQEQMEDVSKQKSETVHALRIDVEEMSSAIQKLKDVRGTLNKLIKDQPQQQTIKQTPIRAQQQQDPFASPQQTRAKLPQDEDGFWNHVENNKSPLRLPKVSQRPY